MGSERCFICTVAGTTANVTDATWVLTRGAKTTDGTVTWMECTGQAALNGDLTNTTTWTAVKAATPAVLGQIIKRSNNASYQICTTAGAMSASEPAFSDTAGVTTTDTTAVWTSLGAVGSYTGGMAPHARLASAFTSTWFIAGNTIYVSSNHAETQSTAITLTPLVASGLAINKIICHNVAGPYPPTSVATGATVTTTGSSAITISANAGGNLYMYGVTLSAGTGTGQSLFLTTNSGSWFYFDNCVLKIPGTSGNFIQVGGGNAGTITFNNVQVSFGAVANGLNFDSNSTFVWQSTGPVLFTGSLVPTTLLVPNVAARKTDIILEALDLSQISGGLWRDDTAASVNVTVIRDCKLHASATVPTPNGTSKFIQFARSSS